MRVLYVKNNSERVKEFQLKTIIYEENGQKFVKKQALCKEAIPHLKKMKVSYQEITDCIINPKIKLAKIIDEGKDSLTFEYIDGISLEKRVNIAAKQGDEKADSIIQEYKELLKIGFKTTLFDSSTMVDNEYKKIFGDFDFSKFDGKLCFDKVSNIDLILSNIIYKDDEIYIIDYEWVFDLSLPVEYVEFRTLRVGDKLYDKIDNYFIKNYVVTQKGFFKVQNNYRKNRLALSQITQQLQDKDQQLQDKDQLIQNQQQQLQHLHEVAQSLRIKNRVKRVFTKSFLKLKTVQNDIKRSFEKPSKDNGKILNLYKNEKKNNNNMLCLFAHYDRDGIVDKYVLNYLEHLNLNGIDIVFVSTAQNLSQQYIKSISKYCRDIIVKENIGYDFGSWKTGFEHIKEELAKYENLIICNDSVYAPLHDVGDMIEKMQRKNVDFWGITNSYEIKPHLQSYFIFFNKNIFSDNVFHTFWNNYLVYKDKRSIIEKYEVGLTDMLVTQGFKYDTFCDAKDVASNKKINITHHFWKELVIQQKCPIIKIELLRDNPVQVNIVNWQNILTDNTNYDIKLIENHLTRMKNR